MAKPKDNGEVKIEEVEVSPDEDTTQTSSNEDNEPRQDYVTREDFDNAVKFLQNSISQLKEQVGDLETVVTAPQGSVEWLEVARPEASDDVPDYVPGIQRDTSNDDTPWYRGH